jgi:hypothetical protein
VQFLCYYRGITKKFRQPVGLEHCEAPVGAGLMQPPRQNAFCFGREETGLARNLLVVGRLVLKTLWARWGLPSTATAMSALPVRLRSGSRACRGRDNARHLSGATSDTRSTSGNSFCKNQHACLTGRRCCFLGVGPRLTNDACDTWCVGPAPFRQAQGPERVEGLVAGLQFIGKTARRQAAALHRTASAQLRPARSFPCIFPNVQRRRRACA